MKYLQVTVSTTSQASELVAMIIYEHGSEGVTINDRADALELIEKKLNWDYVDENLLKNSSNVVLVSGFFAEDFQINGIIESLDELKANAQIPLGALEVTASVVNSQDWENEWRKYYSPIKLGKIVIVPAWQKWDDKKFTPVYIEPGMAFGTGNHETTSMCIELMQKIRIKDKKVLDMGCGSGILGITAGKIGAESVVLSDIDPLAIEASEYNAKLNGVQNACNITQGDLNVGDERYDVVIANITADILLRLKDKLLEALKTDGYAIISGIINARADEVINGYCTDFDLIEIKNNGEWNAMLLRRKI
ncbi:MAG: 50S ribosomal protein L11 methyltransferase [Clostridia bacterium]|nr:50S ribosomal protein L11 methyltransferase [Clostridia bacterium]